MGIERKKKDCDLSEAVYSADSEIHGKGLFARKKIKKGEYIGTYHGPKTRENGTYVLWVYDHDDEDNAEGRDGKNLLRYLNHSTECNAEFDGYDLYALKKIRQDEEITFNYGEEPG